MLSLTISTYEGLAASDLATGNSRDDRRKRLFEAFISRALRRKSKLRKAPTPDRAVRWLSYIARDLGQRFEQVFSLEAVNPSWLPTKVMRRTAVAASAIPAGVLVCTTSGLMIELLFGRAIGWAIGALLGIGFGGIMAAGEGTHLPGVDRPTRSGHIRILIGQWWATAAALGTILGLLSCCIGLAPGAIIATASNHRFSEVLWLSAGIGGAIGATLGLLVASLVVKPFGRKVSEHLPPGASINVAVWSTLALAICVGLPSAIALGAWHGRPGAMAGLLLGATAAYLTSGQAFVLYWVVRLMLAHSGLGPLRLLTFLNFASTAMIVHRLGGGYLFHHRLLLEYFAQLDLSGVPARYTAGALPSTDLRPERLVDYAVTVAGHSPDNAARALAFAAGRMRPEQFAPAAFEVARQMDVRDESRMDAKIPRAHSRRSSFSPRATMRARATCEIYELVVASEHPEFGPAAAVGRAELILFLRQMRDPSGDPYFRQQDVINDLQRAAESGHPVWSTRAASLLAELKNTDELDAKRSRLQVALGRR
ncbi:hypothetical protein GCM10027614_40920 [Micromonospora vulcania]